VLCEHIKSVYNDHITALFYRIDACCIAVCHISADFTSVRYKFIIQYLVFSSVSY